MKDVIDRNFREYFKTSYLVKSVEAKNEWREEKEYSLFCTSLPHFFFNTVMMRSGFTIREEQISPIKDFFTQQNLPFSLWCDVLDLDEEALGVCERHQLALLAEQDFTYTRPAGSKMSMDERVKRVTTPEEWKNWLVPFMEVFEFPLGGSVEQFLFEWGMVNMKKSPEEFINFYIEEKGEVASVCSLYVTGRYAGVYNMATLEKFRRLGLGRYLVSTIIEYCRENNIEAVGGLGSSMGMELYKNFDIEVAGKIQLRAFIN
ncbi:MAG: GNAT family N-acetyltransferase [Bacteriovoracales bacterium]|nr:GNAT family N-acetyltransferase [Bacteriovoracales bacterium]